MDYAFTLKKIAWILFPPLNLTMLLLLGGLAMKTYRMRGGRALFAAGVALFIAFGLLPSGQYALSVLERQYNPPALPAKIDGIVVLGGAFDVKMSGAHAMPAVYGSAERVIEAARLMRRYPAAPLIYSGGNGLLEGNMPPETVVFQDFLRRLGISDSEVRYETRSRDTYENIIYSRAIARPGKGSVWILVTSAWHMPRAMALAKKYWPGVMLAYPVDYQTLGTNADIKPSFDILGNYEAATMAMREYLAILLYRIGGKINSPL